MAGTLIKTFAPVIAGVVVISEFAAPYLIMLYYFGVACWQWADKHGRAAHQDLRRIIRVLLRRAAFGRHHGGGGLPPDRLRTDEASLKVLFDDFKKVQEAHQKDDQDDSNRDGKADVDSLTARKGRWSAKSCCSYVRPIRNKPREPCRRSSGFLAVLAPSRSSSPRLLWWAVPSRRIKTARKKGHGAVPQKSAEDYHKWIRPGLNYACKLVAVSICGPYQRIISAFHSAVRGWQIAGDVGC